jgi:hypothetical protein
MVGRNARHWREMDNALEAWYQVSMQTARPLMMPFTDLYTFHVQ